jgi:hypothetical protein
VTKTLVERLEEREVLLVYTNVSSQLHSQIPNPSKVHALANIRSFFGGNIAEYKSGQKTGRAPEQETFGQLKQRNGGKYTQAIDLVRRAVEEFGVVI